MLEYLDEFLVGNCRSDFATKTENQEIKDNQQERLLDEKDPQRLYARPFRRKIKSDLFSDEQRHAEMHVRHRMMVSTDNASSCD